MRRKSTRYIFGAVLLLIISSLGLFIMRPKKLASQEVVEKLPSHLVEVDPDSVNWKEKTEDYWKSVLTPEQYTVCRGAGTERPFTGTYCNFKESGTYICSNCGRTLFSSKSKFDSGTGWPSFTEAVDNGALELREDRAHGMVRTEAICGRCGAHLGHVFDDGPAPSRKRFCINSVCLVHKPEE